MRDIVSESLPPYRTLEIATTVHRIRVILHTALYPTICNIPNLIVLASRRFPSHPNRTISRPAKLDAHIRFTLLQEVFAGQLHATGKDLLVMQERQKLLWYGEELVLVLQ